MPFSSLGLLSTAHVGDWRNIQRCPLEPGNEYGQRPSRSLIESAQIDKAGELSEFEDFLFRVPISDPGQGLRAGVALVFAVVSVAASALALEDGIPVPPQFGIPDDNVRFQGTVVGPEHATDSQFLTDEQCGSACALAPEIVQDPALRIRDEMSVPQQSASARATCGGAERYRNQRYAQRSQS